MSRVNTTCGIYKILNKVNGKLYIGSSKKIENRMYQHKWELQRNEHHSKLLQRAWNKYGADAFEFKTILICAENKLFDYEQSILDFYQAYNPEKGYNICQEVDRPPIVTYSDERRKQMSEERKGKQIYKNNPDRYAALIERAKLRSGENHPRYGKTPSQETIEKFRATRKANAKPSWNKGGTNEKLKGRKRSQETINKIIESKRSKTCPYSKVTHDQVKEIRAIKAFTGLSNAKIGLMYNLHRASIALIVNRKNYAYI